jgi:hypothetical protein
MTRDNQGKQIRIDAANFVDYIIPAVQQNNGDEALYPSRIGNYSKGMSHSAATGEVDPAQYNIFKAIVDIPPNLENPILGFNTIPKAGDRKYVNPQSGLAYDPEGLDSHALTLSRPAPKLASQEAAGEMVELYWMALLRDVPFSRFEGLSAEPLVDKAVDDLNALNDFKGPKEGGIVTRHTIFRGFTPGDLIGPYVSQFLLWGVTDPTATPELTELDGYIKYGTLRISQKQTTVKRGTDYMKDFGSWLEIQNGVERRKPPYCSVTAGHKPYDPVRRYIRNMRDLANYVHIDQVPQEFVNACLILLQLNVPCVPPPNKPNFPFSPGNPYVDPNLGHPNPDSVNQEGYATFGPRHILTLVTEVANRALKAAWYQKWFVHRRLRPEAFGGLVDRMRMSQIDPTIPNPGYPLDNDILQAPVLDRIHKHNDKKSYLLPQAFPEGSPLHPSYPAGHATVSGACVTVLKAFFQEDYLFPRPVIPDPHLDGDEDKSGTKLVHYNGPDKNMMTVGGELNKLASNISIGRNMAGVHYRSDYVESLILGENVAISILKDQEKDFNEPYCLKFHKFDGITEVKIGNNCPP